MTKPIVLTFIRHYLPGYKSGGPIRTIANTVEHLGDRLDFRIITSDRDFGENRPYAAVHVGEWNRVGNAAVLYLPIENQSIQTLTECIRQTPHDLVYLNGFFDPIFTQRPLLARRLGLLPSRPTILAPRGEFSPGALALKAWKKLPYVKLSRLVGLYRNLVWQASSDHEREDIRREVGPTARTIVVTPNLGPGDPPQITARSRALTEPLRLVFLSRISPKKNLDFALRMLANVRVPVEFSIYGTIENERYWHECERLIQRLPGHVCACYKGAIEYREVPRRLAEHDLFLLPTRGENYGHAIIEAWSVGLPVLISDQTPWQDLEDRGIGWALPLSSQPEFVAAIESLATLDEEEWRLLRNRAIRFASRVTADEKTEAANLSLFLDAIETRPRQ